MITIYKYEFADGVLYYGITTDPVSRDHNHRNPFTADENLVLALRLLDEPQIQMEALEVVEDRSLALAKETAYIDGAAAVINRFRAPGYLAPNSIYADEAKGLDRKRALAKLAATKAEFGSEDHRRKQGAGIAKWHNSPEGKKAQRKGMAKRRDHWNARRRRSHFAQYKELGGGHRRVYKMPLKERERHRKEYKLVAPGHGLGNIEGIAQRYASDAADKFQWSRANALLWNATLRSVGLPTQTLPSSKPELRGGKEAYAKQAAKEAAKQAKLAAQKAIRSQVVRKQRIAHQMLKDARRNLKRTKNAHITATLTLRVLESLSVCPPEDIQLAAQTAKTTLAKWQEAVEAVAAAEQDYQDLQAS